VSYVQAISLSALIISTVGFVWLYQLLRSEGEMNAPGRLLRAVGPALLAWAVLIVVAPPGVLMVILLLLAAGVVFVGWAVYRGLRFSPPEAAPLGLGQRSVRTDERDTMFARMAYTPGGPAYEDYYSSHPERRAVDDGLRELPELCQEGSLTYDNINSPVAPAIFELLEKWHPLVDMHGSGERVAVEGDGGRKSMSRRLKGLAKYYGAVDAGVAELTPEFVYTHVGRRESEYGTEIDLDHQYGLIFAVEMDYRYIRSAPRLPVVVESSHQYMEAAKVALALAANIRALGWDARAHMDGNYLAVLPPLAVRAGLGEIGRMGLLVTERYGPRVRLGLVTTNMPLEPDKPRPFGLQEFCAGCQKCAETCPPRAIGTDPRAPEDGWHIEWERCYKFWRISGADCATCISSCPYSKPSSFFHQLTRLAVRNSSLFRRVALWADDWLYGKRHFDTWEPDWFDERGV